MKIYISIQASSYLYIKTLCSIKLRSIQSVIEYTMIGARFHTNTHPWIALLTHSFIVLSTCVVCALFDGTNYVAPNRKNTHLKHSKSNHSHRERLRLPQQNVALNQSLRDYITPKRFHRVWPDSMCRGVECVSRSWADTSRACCVTGWWRLVRPTRMPSMHRSQFREQTGSNVYE